MEFVNFTNGHKTTDILVCFDLFGDMVFWVDYDINFVGIFHDNSNIVPRLLNGKTAELIPENKAKEILKKISKATSKTSANRYSVEIDNFLNKYCEESTPF